MDVECLSCGQVRHAEHDAAHPIVSADACGRCGYLGWAPSRDLNESVRRQLRDRPVVRRRLLTLA